MTPAKEKAPWELALHKAQTKNISSSKYHKPLNLARGEAHFMLYHSPNTCPDGPLEPRWPSPRKERERLLEEFQLLEDEHESRVYRLMDLEDRMEDLAMELGNLDCPVKVRRICIQ